MVDEEFHPGGSFASIDDWLVPTGAIPDPKLLAAYEALRQTVHDYVNSDAYDDSKEGATHFPAEWVNLIVAWKNLEQIKNGH